MSPGHDDDLNAFRYHRQTGGNISRLLFPLFWNDCIRPQLISICERTRDMASLARTWRPTIFLSTFAFSVAPNNLAAQGLPVETGSHIPVALWFVGAVILGLAIAYGIMRNRHRTVADKRKTDRATKQLYTEEEMRDRARTGAD